MTTFYYTQDVPKEDALKIFATMIGIKERHNLDRVYHYHAGDRCIYIYDGINRPESVEDITILKARYGYDNEFINVSDSDVKLLIGSLT